MSDRRSGMLQTQLQSKQFFKITHNKQEHSMAANITNIIDSKLGTASTANFQVRVINGDD